MVEPFHKFKSELTKEEEAIAMEAEFRDIFTFVEETIGKIEEK